MSPFRLRPFDMTLIPDRCGLSAAQTREKQVLTFMLNRGSRASYTFCQHIATGG